ncbi:MAG: 2-C-methyl-D-erythritol 4-phosphate cytidylyltransferase, partial [Sphingomonadaceae bacterium]|nr:2-C-methyl-D-erythritol 4-phosphate cytidylyltransferase [Sphingomonadaceae bacterium]
MASRPTTVALIVAAGSGSRAGGAQPKQFRLVRGKPMLWHSYATLAAHSDIDQVYVAVGEGQEAEAEAVLAGLREPIFVLGGLTRRESVYLGLKAIATAQTVDQVLIHDAARPFLPA